MEYKISKIYSESNIPYNELETKVGKLNKRVKIIQMRRDKEEFIPTINEKRLLTIKEIGGNIHVLPGLKENLIHYVGFNPGYKPTKARIDHYGEDSVHIEIGNQMYVIHVK